MVSAIASMPSRSTWTGRVARPWIGYAGFVWALSYIPIHVYWALGGLTPAIGLTTSSHEGRIANWGASVVILGAGLISLALVQSWGQLIPRVLRHGTALVGAVFGLLHFAAFAAMSALRLGGVRGYPGDADATVQQMHNYDVANLLYFEPWFGVMGLLLVAGVRQDRRPDGAGVLAATHALPAWVPNRSVARRAAIALLGVGAAMDLMWAYGTDLLLPSRPDGSRRGWSTLLKSARTGGPPVGGTDRS